MGEQKSELEGKIKGVVREAAGDSELSDEALEQIAGGVATDLAARFKKAGIDLSPGAPISGPEVPEAESD